MPDFKIFETDEFIKRIKKLKGPEKEKFHSRLKMNIYPQLRKNPYYHRNIKKLINWDPETWRYKWRTFRIFYEIDQDKGIINILTFKHRRDAY